MGSRVERKRPSLVRTRGSATKKNRTENAFEKKAKCTRGLGSKGRYFSKRIEVIEDDNGTNDNSDGDPEMESDDAVEADQHQNERTGSDEDCDSGSNDDGTTSDDNCVAGNDDDGTGNDDDHGTKDGSGTGDDEDDGIGSDHSGTGSNEDDDNKESADSCSNEGEEESKNGDDSKIVLQSKKQKTSNKLHNSSTVAKKMATPVHKLPKFQGTAKANKRSQQLEDTESPTRKRKETNNDEIENEISPAKKSCVLDNETESLVEKRKEERDARSLFLKNLPPNSTAEIVKKLSPEIINVRIPLESKKHLQSLYAFVEFENEEAAERNYKNFMTKKINNKKFTVDFCGEKSNYRKTARKAEYPVNVRRLFIPNIPSDITADELKEHIPEAKTFTLKLRGTKRLMFVSFENENEARKAFEESGKLVIRGKKLTVLFAYKKKRPRATMHPRKRLEIIPSIFEDDEESTETIKMKTKDTRENFKESTKINKMGRKNKQKNLKISTETTKMEIASELENKNFKATTEATKMKAKRKKKNFIRKNKK